MEIQTGIDAKDYSLALSKGDLKPVEQKLLKIKEKAGLMRKESVAVGKVDEEMRRMTEEMGGRVVVSGVWVLVFVVGVAGVQVYAVRKVLKSKKVL